MTATLSSIGKLEPVPLRELWKHEERGLSAWLENNLEALAEAVGVSLSDPQREFLAGNFQVDLVAEDENGDRVIVENQLEATDHDHLGKLLTYLTNIDAKTAIWISSAPRPEHIRAVQWLNETTPDDIAFYLVRLAAYRIGSSEAAPLFTIIVGPSIESKSFGKQKKQLAERHILRLKFWEQLLPRAKEKGVLLHAQRAPSKEAWISAGAGVRAGVNFVYMVWMTDETAVELYIDTGDKEENKRIFDALHNQKAEIEQAFGSSLSWERLDEKRASRIRYVLREGGLTEEGKWPIIQDTMIAAMERLAKAVKPHLAKASGIP
ncbi:MAG: hypothetical protein A3G20_10030 [Acidobacteria bacterium RIFCSPLOWO2_12_FULL_59_11]|nr:MAG: hypothetical protein A3G20_10030 [Acidobacteria bacterium RIFCSPLOWO2_12_FULL_59_11]